MTDSFLSDGPAPSTAAEVLPPPMRFAGIPGLICAFRIDDGGKVNALPVDQPIELSDGGWLWLHLDLTKVPVTQWLKTLELPDPAVATMLSHDQHQQLHVVDGCVYGILADLVREIHGAGDEVGYLRFLMTDRLLLTGRHHALCCIESARSAIQGQDVRLPHCGSLLEMIVEHVADGIDEVADDLASKLDEIEDQLAVRSIDRARQNLATVRRSSVRLHRLLSGLRTVLTRLERQGATVIDRRLQIRAGQLGQRIEGLDHLIVEIRERGYRLQDEVSATINEETNRHLHLLSVLTGLLLPPTLVAGVFGMNVKLPLDEDTGFPWAMVIVFGSAIVAYVVLRLVGILRSRG